MGFKENLALLFKPDWRRILLLLAIGIFYYYFWSLVVLIVTCEECEGLYGYPIPFSANFVSLISEQYSAVYSMTFFFIDAYVWYLLACEIVLAYDIWKGKVFTKKVEPEEKPKEEERQKEEFTEKVTEESLGQPSSEPQPQA